METEGIRKYKNFDAVLLVAPMILFIFFSGCATSGTARGAANLEKAMSKITKGTTTKEEVRQLLGEPDGVFKNSNSTEMWTYSRSDLYKKMAQRNGALLVGTGVTSAAMFLLGPVAGIAGILTTGAVATSPMKTSYESITVNFDSKGIVSDVSSSTQEVGKQ